MLRLFFTFAILDTSMDTQQTLLIGAHPDDLETLLGGAAEGLCFACVATDGEASTVNHMNEANYVVKGNRRKESHEGLRRTGIPLERQYYLNLPDGDLASSTHFAQLVTALRHLILSEHITRIFTLGADGFDEHPDHIATHLATLKALEQIQQKHPSLAFEVYALNAHGRGEHIVSVDTRRKLHAMCAHKSQFLVSEQDEKDTKNCAIICGHSIDTDFWEYFKPYHQLILKQETYNFLPYPALHSVADAELLEDQSVKQ